MNYISLMILTSLSYKRSCKKINMKMYPGDIRVEKTNELVITNKEPAFQNKAKKPKNVKSCNIYKRPNEN